VQGTARIPAKTHAFLSLRPGGRLRYSAINPSRKKKFAGKNEPFAPPR
jgi:hypothetical protein